MLSAATVTSLESSEAAIFARLWESENRSLSPTLARHVLKLQFSPSDKARMHELAEKNSVGTITSGELEELDNFVRVGDLLAILQSKARRRLRSAASGAARNG